MNEPLDLIQAAKKENWDYVDNAIESNADKYSSWAYNQGIMNTDNNVRDLAVSILEKAHFDGRFSGMRATIYTLMTTDSHKYVRFRSAFTLAAHGPGEYKDSVLQTLKEAEQDEDVSEIARKYIEKLKN